MATRQHGNGITMATITSQPSALAWPILHPWTPRRGFFWLAWTTVFWKFIKNEPPDLSFIKSDIWLFFKPGKPLGLWSRQRCSSQRASLPGTWAGSRKDCPGDYDGDHGELEKGSDGIALGKKDVAFAMFGDFSFLLFVHLLGDQLHLNRVLLANFEVESSHTELENWKWFFLFSLQNFFCFLTSRCLTGFPAVS